MNLSHIVVLVLRSSGGFKGVRILNTLLALEPGASPFAIVFSTSAVVLAAGGLSNRAAAA